MIGTCTYQPRDALRRRLSPHANGARAKVVDIIANKRDVNAAAVDPNAIRTATSNL